MWLSHPREETLWASVSSHHIQATLAREAGLNPAPSWPRTPRRSRASAATSSPVWFLWGWCASPRAWGGEGACEGLFPQRAGGWPQATRGLQVTDTQRAPQIFKPLACATRSCRPLVPCWDTGLQPEDGVTDTHQSVLKATCQHAPLCPLWLEGVGQGPGVQALPFLQPAGNSRPQGRLKPCGLPGLLSLTPQ